jgi:hypothetical protein
MCSEQPDIDAMLDAGIPLWAAFALWVEVLYDPDVPHDVWWDRLKGEPPPTERLR